MKNFKATIFTLIFLSVSAAFITACGSGGGGGGGGSTTNTTPPAVTSVSLARTGQTICYNATGVVIACAGTGQDGELTKGVAWPIPRFTDNGNGSVTDSLTGLIWLKDANCFGSKTWPQALTDANTLANGQCGLTDGSQAGDWRLPNRKELQSLIDRSKYNPALPTGHQLVFTNVQSNYYWSSSTYASGRSYAWSVDMWGGSVGDSSKGYSSYVWPVRSGN